MKTLLVIMALASSVIVFGQSLNEKLKAAVIKAETVNFLKDTVKYKELKITSLNVEILRYRIISLRDWWLELANAHKAFAAKADSLMNLAKQQNGSTAANAADARRPSTSAGADSRSKQKPRNEMAEYFEAKYKSSPASVKAYEVSYKVDLSSNMGFGNHRDYLRIILDMKNLSEIRSF